MLRQSKWPLMLLDYQLSDEDGLTVLDEINKLPEGDRPAVVMLTGSGNEQVAVEGRRIGLFSYGSGSCAEFLAARVGPDAAAWRERTGLHELLRRRRELDHAGYLEFRRRTEALDRNGSFQEPAPGAPTSFCGTTGHRRVYHDVRRPLSIPPALPSAAGDDDPNARDRSGGR